MSAITTHKIGRARISKIPELALENVAGSFLYPQWQDDIAQDAAKALPAYCFSGEFSSLAQSTHSWLLQVDGLTLLIDTASGNGKSRPRNQLFHQLDVPYLARLREAGVEPEQVDYVFNTHLHVDHVGWNTVLSGGRWVPTFPNARYIFSQKEFVYYADPDNVRQPSEFVHEDSVAPIVAAGMGTLINGDDDFPLAGFQLHSTPGHSYDHLSLSFTSEGETAFFWGDVMHHPLQIALPQWNSVFCEFPEQSLHSRRKALEFAVATRATVFTTHFPGASAGRIETNAEGQLQWLSL
ncbi:MBL fold metallo-hydrolase [Serratia rubidaea]|uniref:MBL fold metallo-hydrolase n=1 Tax=Serratia rubidaea TaxID=61652 RepID=UPI00177FE78F|nr:MBL fold metallo-hydrolase [Serratia rubidaea]MBD8451243.1 MBL fold metallo-hydrolase [Serratia rubidaea]